LIRFCLDLVNDQLYIALRSWSLP